MSISPRYPAMRGMAARAASARLVYCGPGKHLTCVAAETVPVGGLINAVMRLVALIAGEP